MDFDENSETVKARLRLSQDYDLETVRRVYAELLMRDPANLHYRKLLRVVEAEQKRRSRSA